MAQPKKSQYISFRVTEEQLNQIENAAADAGTKAREWCRDVVLENLNRDHRLSEGERMLFEQFARGQYLVTQGFQLVADDKLTSEMWMKFRRYADEHTPEIADRALARYAKSNGQSR